MVSEAGVLTILGVGAFKFNQAADKQLTAVKALQQSISVLSSGMSSLMGTITETGKAMMGLYKSTGSAAQEFNQALNGSRTELLTFMENISGLKRDPTKVHTGSGAPDPRTQLDDLLDRMMNPDKQTSKGLKFTVAGVTGPIKAMKKGFGIMKAGVGSIAKGGLKMAAVAVAMKFIGGMAKQFQETLDVVGDLGEVFGLIFLPISQDLTQAIVKLIPPTLDLALKLQPVIAFLWKFTSPVGILIGMLSNIGNAEGNITQFGVTWNNFVGMFNTTTLDTSGFFNKMELSWDTDMANMDYSGMSSGFAMNLSSSVTSALTNIDYSVLFDNEMGSIVSSFITSLKDEMKLADVGDVIDEMLEGFEEYLKDHVLSISVDDIVNLI